MNRSKKAKGLERSRRIVVAMSGGVDSSVAAALLKSEGFDVVGVFMKFWKDLSTDSGQDGGENRCCSVESEKMARLVAKKIGISFYVLNVEKEFKKKVVDYFLKEYKKGNTPNPCVVCNKEIKFGLLIEKALKMGADYIATGHYAKTKDGRLFQGKDKEKDQSYFLWQLNQKQLSRVLFPVENYTKPEVRKLAKIFNLPTAETKESQEVCFIQNTTNEFLKKYLKVKSGNIIDKTGNILGKHEGLHFYTIGQRKGIGLSGGPYFVIEKDFKNNILVVSKNKKDLLKKELVAKNINWILRKKLPVSCDVKIRYKSNFAKAKVFENPSAGSGQSGKIIFQKPEEAITPGQSAVFYVPVRSSEAKEGVGKELIGGGTIDKIIK